MDKLSSYSEVCVLGHKSITEILSGDVLIEEKIDGSQFSFALIDGNLLFRSKGAVIYFETVPSMFRCAVDTVIALKDRLEPNWIYRGEVLCKPKHNVLAYERVPSGNIIIFDIDKGEQNYLDYESKFNECIRLGLECVPAFIYGKIGNKEQIMNLLDNTSILGGQKVEGVVIKNYLMFTPDKKVAMAKVVSDKFKEVHDGEWRKNNPTKKDIIQTLIDRYKTEARWQKSIQHLRDDGILTDSPKDIGALIKAIMEDVKKEEIEEIKDTLFTHFWGQISRGITYGFPEWYKDKLLNDAFNNDNTIKEDK